MCLDIVTKRPIPNAEEVTRYKILRVENNRIMFPNRHDYQFKVNPATWRFPGIKLNIWMEAAKKEIKCEKDWRMYYTSGFHIFKTLEDAKQALDGKDCTYLSRSEGDAIFEVKVKDIFLEGEQQGIPVEVCSFLKVIKKLHV